MWVVRFYSFYKFKVSSGDFERRTTPLSAYADISPERGDILPPSHFVCHLPLSGRQGILLKLNVSSVRRP